MLLHHKGVFLVGELVLVAAAEATRRRHLSLLPLGHGLHELDFVEGGPGWAVRKILADVHVVG
jgi:hypothetical protein